MTPQGIAVWVARSYHGLWYSWGGDDPNGFDCSGLMVECLKSAGVLSRGTDYTAQNLYDKFPKVDEPKRGVLVFWGSADGSVKHVEMCIDSMFCIGASGGGRQTKTLEDAMRDNAFIKIRPINRTRTFIGYADPFKDAV